MKQPCRINYPIIILVKSEKQKRKGTQNRCWKTNYIWYLLGAQFYLKVSYLCPSFHRYYVALEVKNIINFLMCASSNNTFIYSYFWIKVVHALCQVECWFAFFSSNSCKYFNFNIACYLNRLLEDIKRLMFIRYCA